MSALLAKSELSPVPVPTYSPEINDLVYLVDSSGNWKEGRIGGIFPPEQEVEICVFEVTKEGYGGYRQSVPVWELMSAEHLFAWIVRM